MARLRQDGWQQRLRRHGAGIVLFTSAALAGGAAGLVAPPTPWWLPGALFPVVSVVVARTYELHWRPDARDLHVRAAVHVGGLAVVAHLAGWGALLVPMYLLPASDLQRVTGLAVGRIPVRWATAATAVGQALVWTGALPSVLPQPLSLGTAVLSVLVLRAVALRLESDETALAEAAGRAEQRAARLRTVLAASGQAVLVADRGRLELASDAARQLAGALDEQDTLAALLRGVHPDDHAQLALVLGGTSPLRPTEGSATVRLQRPPGTWAPIDVTWQDDAATGEVAVHLHERSEADRLRDQLRRSRHVDTLTGLDTDHVVARRLPQLLSLVARGAAGAAVLLVDLDDFAACNAAHGNAVGDELLRAVARDLRQAVRDHDTVARVGGDEFVVLLEGLATPAEAAATASRLVGVLSARRVLDGTVLAVGASIGVRHLEPGARAARVLADARRSVDLARHAGGGRVVVHGDTARRATLLLHPWSEEPVTSGEGRRPAV